MRRKHLKKRETVFHTIRDRVFQHKALNLLLVLTLLLGFVPGGIFGSPNVAAATLPDADPALYNYPSQFDDWEPGEVIVQMLSSGEVEWSEPPSIIHSFYDASDYARAYTPATSVKYNGYPTPDHAVFDGDNIRFLGYGQVPYMDMVFTDEYEDGFTSMSFLIRPIVMNFHTFSEGGILFNGSFDNSNRYTGYMLLLKCGNMEGMRSTGTAVLSLVYCENELMDGNMYDPGTLATTRSDQIILKTRIENLTTPTFRIDIERNLLTGGFQVYLDGQEGAEVSIPKSAKGGFGFFTAYYEHNCSLLSVVEFNGIMTKIESPGPAHTYATVRFMDINTVDDLKTGAGGEEIAEPQYMPIEYIPGRLLTNPEYLGAKRCYGYANDMYYIEPPATIGDYRYVSASRATLDPIVYRINSANNEIILYYDISVGAVKSAQVGGVAGDGAQYAPIPADFGGEIDYTISLLNVSAARESEFRKVAIAAGAGHVLAIDESGQLYTWGNNILGNLGALGDLGGNSPTMINISALSGSPLKNVKITAVAAGLHTSMALDADGNVWHWGQNIQGHLGNGNTTNSSTPINISTLPSSLLKDVKITAIACGDSHSMAIDENGNVWTWGQNTYGQLGNMTTASSTTPNPNPINISALSGHPFNYVKITAIACGSGHSIAIDENGNVWAWGNNLMRQLGNGSTTDSSTPINISAPVASPINNVKITDITCGQYHNMAIDENGNVWAWGRNTSGQLGLGDTTTVVNRPTKVTALSDVDVKAITCGQSTSFALDASGKVLSWGNNPFGILGNGTSSGNTSWPGYVIDEDMSDKVVGITAGVNNGWALDENGLVWAWGINSAGELGNGTGANSPVPVKSGKDAEPFIVTDLLPKGLRFTGVYSVTKEDGLMEAEIGRLLLTATEEDDRDLIIFVFDRLPKGTTQFHFTAKVESNGLFENAGQFFDGDKKELIETNATYHATGLVDITEKYQQWPGSPVLSLPKDDTHRYINTLKDGENDYSPYPATLSPIVDGDGNKWQYYAYSVDGAAPVVGNPPMDLGWVAMYAPDTAPADCWLIPDVKDGHTVIFYFVKDLNLTIDYRAIGAETGSDLKNQFTASIPAMTAYNLTASHMNSFANDAGTWNYANKYSLDGGSNWQTGLPPVPTYDAVAMTPTADISIILCFTLEPVVTVQYREYESGQPLFNDNGASAENFILQGSGPTYEFNPVGEDSVADTIANGAVSILGVRYRSYYGWSIDGGATITEGNPPAFNELEGGETVILYFEWSEEPDPPEQYTITERFREKDNTVNILDNDKTTDMDENDSFDGEWQESLTVGTVEYTYWGYQIDNDEPQEGAFDGFRSVDGNHTVTYLYISEEPGHGTEPGLNQYTITERFREKDNTGNTLAADKMTGADENDSFYGEWEESLTVDTVEYTCWGYQIDNETPVEGQFPGFSSVQADHTVTYLYTTEETGPGTEPGAEQYTVTERFREKGNTSTTLVPNKMTEVDENDSFDGEWQDSLIVDTVEYTYWGYQIDSDEPVEGDFPGFGSVEGDHTVTYLYTTEDPGHGTEPGVNQYTITERFREKDNIGNTLIPNKMTEVNENEPFTGDQPGSLTFEMVEYTYWGYQIGSDNPVEGAFPGFDAVDGSHTVTYLYTAEQPGAKLDPASVVIAGSKSVTGTGAPSVGFSFTLTQLNSADVNNVMAGGVTLITSRTGAGSFEFEPITNLTAVGSPYYFKVQETNGGSGSRWTNDTTARLVTVTISGNDPATADIFWSGGGLSIFTNRYSSGSNNGGGGDSGSSVTPVPNPEPNLPALEPEPEEPDEEELMQVVTTQIEQRQEDELPEGSITDISPVASDPENTVTQDGENWLEVDPDGTPLGLWTWDDDLMEWVFEAFPPLSVPKTGLENTILLPALIALILIVLMTASGRRRRRKA